MFSNLLGNAIKYSPAGGAIEVDATICAHEVNVIVADRGIGIPADDLVRLFERYHRGSNVSGIVGTGVGLYLVKMVVELHGGRIAVDSTEGEGSRFTVSLPLKGAAGATLGPPVRMQSSETPATTPSLSEQSGGAATGSH